MKSKSIFKTNRDHTEEIVSVEQIKQIKKETRERKLKAIRSLATRVQVAPDGTRTFIRFSQSQCLEHYVLIASFGTLAVTGLLQTLSHFSIVGWIMQILGNVETVRAIHHFAAAVLALQSVYHVEQILVTWIVKRERGGMWPSVRDFRNLVQTVMFNLGLAKQKPKSDRFSGEEKLEYWALLWGTPVMGITGFILWFPTIATAVLPGEIVPIAQAIHSWEAILATLAILTWHMYHTNIKEKNRSIFTGTMTEKEMQHAHPLEYQRLFAAHEYLQKNRLGDDGREGNQTLLAMTRKEVGQEEQTAN